MARRRRDTSYTPWTVVVATGFVVAACSGDAPVPSAEVVDSAGVRIVSFDLTDVPVPTYRIVTPHDLEVGALDGAPEYTFSPCSPSTLAQVRLTSFAMSGELIQTASLPMDEVGRPQSMMRQDDGTYLLLSRWVPPTDGDELYDVRMEIDSIVIEYVDGAGLSSTRCG